METKFHQISVKVGQREEMPLMLHENIANGKFGDTEVTVARNMSGRLLLIALGDNNYIVDMADIVQGLIEHEEGKIIEPLKTKCPGPTFAPGDTAEDHEGCCVAERQL